MEPLKKLNRLNKKILVGSIILFIVFAALTYTGHLVSLIEFTKSDYMTLKVGKVHISLHDILIGIIIIFIVIFTSNLLINLIVRNIGRIKNIKSTNRQLLINITQVVVYLVAFLIALDLLNIELTTFAIFGGAIVFGIGFGLRTATSNFISGVILLFEETIKKDDIILIGDSSDTYGVVKEVKARYTLIEALDGRSILIPNDDLMSKKVTNWTLKNKKSRIELYLAVNTDNYEKAINLLIVEANKHPECIEHHKTICLVRKIANGSAHLSLFFWIADISKDVHIIKSELFQSAYKALKSENIDIL